MRYTVAVPLPLLLSGPDVRGFSSTADSWLGNALPAWADHSLPESTTPAALSVGRIRNDSHNRQEVKGSLCPHQVYRIKDVSSGFELFQSIYVSNLGT